MNRTAVKGRRTFVYVTGQTACVIWGQPAGRYWSTWAVASSLHAYSVNCYRKLAQVGGKLDRDGCPTWEATCASKVARLVNSEDLAEHRRSGSVVYAFYSHENRSVKIGRTSALLNRWTKLENESGYRRQLLSVWRTQDARELEHALHMRWLPHRTFGEWFAAAPVLADLRQQVQVPA